jgi:hypothetical protein
MGSKYQTHLRPKQNVITRRNILFLMSGFFSFVVISLVVYLQFTQYEYAEGSTNNQLPLDQPDIELPKMVVQKSFDEDYPVTLARFNTILNPISVELRWKCASEKDNDHFIIDRSIDGCTFNEIGQVKSIGSSVRSSNYSFVDKNPGSGTIFYRLKQVSSNGFSSYVAIDKTVRDNKNTDKPLYIETIVPKNFNKFLNINYFSSEDGGVAVEIFNKDGVNIFKAYTMAKRGYNTCRFIDTNIITNEEYSLRISTPNAAFVSKLKREV